MYFIFLYIELCFPIYKLLAFSTQSTNQWVLSPLICERMIFGPTERPKQRQGKRNKRIGKREREKRKKEKGKW